ncbi:regulatory helix-turn-helix LysR family protein [Paraburkholderia sp. BL8N3]|nr:regulatory helix-turn-helix LysR family protein [Paraburkholderia sp. BL8N3]
MRFKGLDLNLLVALDALMTERNLTAAARSINLSQPAMSAAVARLRAYFCDELFTMRGRELVPTPRAEGLAAPIREALVHIQLSVISRDEDGYFKSGVGNAAYEACGLKAAKSSFPAMRNSTVRMVLKLAYPRALRLAA